VKVLGELNRYRQKRSAAGIMPVVFTSLLDLKGRAKFDAWEVRKGMSTDAAKEAYVKFVDRLLGK